MRKLLLITCIASCQYIPTRIVRDTVYISQTKLLDKPLKKIDYDSLAKAVSPIVKAKANYEIGDTVIYPVVMHGQSVGIIKAEKTVKDNDYYYIVFFNCNCNGWYRDYKYSDPMLPYSSTWNTAP